MKPQSMFEANVANSINEIPAPKVPGTTWQPNTGYKMVDGKEVYFGYTATYCTICQKPYNSHVFDHERKVRNACPASDEAWAAYWDARRRNNRQLLTNYIINQLSILPEGDRIHIMGELQTRFSTELSQAHR